ncbi:hypothetical protein [Streptomyces azureus]|uniref:Uncharacterized protein n=1 Tax=Streptomyces azureus TaxID=146537 RepID=A0A0K8PYZ1_STRAJ|nr:hypothetical protein [Streptomyces azureus]GAP52938.1 putative uncharacterized protein [Streptomyces azureus]
MRHLATPGSADRGGPGRLLAASAASVTSPYTRLTGALSDINEALREAAD